MKNEIVRLRTTSRQKEKLQQLADLNHTTITKVINACIRRTLATIDDQDFIFFAGINSLKPAVKN